jgi:uncharacterized protein (DUF305 family)
MRTKHLALSALVGVIAAVIAWFLLGTYMHRQSPPQPEPVAQAPAAPAASAGHVGHVPAPGSGPMGTILTGDPDKDFAQEMIVHHEMALEMAKDVMEKGKDPEIKKLAEDVIVAQTKEIEFLRAWLEKQPK